MRRVRLFAFAVALIVSARPSWAGELEAVRDASQRQALAAQIVQSWEAVQSRTPDKAWKNALRARIAEQFTLAELQAVPSGSLPQPSLLADGATVNRLGDSQADLVYTPVAPCRIVDTRLAGGILAPGASRDFWVTGAGFTDQGGVDGSCGVPLGPATAVMLNFVATSSAGPGHLQAWPYAGAVPVASTLNYGAVTGLAAIANGLAIPICDPAATTCTHDFTAMSSVSATHLVVDVVGYFSKSASDVISASSVLVWDFTATYAYVDCITSVYAPTVNERVVASSVSSMVGSASGTIFYAQNVYSTDGGTTWSTMSLEGQILRATTVVGYWVPLPNLSFMNLTAGSTYKFGIRYQRYEGTATMTDGRCELLVVPR